MRKGTFSVQRANPNSAKHNSRELAPKYLIDTSAKNYYELLKKDDDFILEAQQIYKQKIKQTMQKKQVENLIQETVLTLRPNQNENDVKELFKKLNKKYGGHELLEVAIHRDEGYFLKDDIAYYPTKNILKKDDDWYVCSDTSIKKPKVTDFDTKVDINEFEKVFNYHAHAKFSMFDRETGKTARMQKKDMSARIKFVSDELGLIFAPDKETSLIKKSVNLVKDEHLARARANEEKKKLKAELEELKKANNELRAELKANKDLSKRENFKLQEDLDKNLQADLKDNKIDLPTALAKIEELKKEIFHPTIKKDKEPAKYKEVANYYLKQNKSLQEQNKVLEGKVMDLEEKIVSSATIIANLEQKLKNIISLANEKIKSLLQFKTWNNYNLKRTRDWNKYINTEREDYWEELIHYNSDELDTLYKESLETELINLDDIKLDDLDLDLDLKESIEDKKNIEEKEIKEIELKENVKENIEVDFSLPLNR